MSRAFLAGTLIALLSAAPVEAASLSAGFQESGASIKKEVFANVSSEVEAEKRIADLLNMKRKKKSKKEGLSARSRTMAEAASTLGFQEGFKYEYEKLLAEAESRSSEMERIFDFRRLLIDGKVLPPVIRWSGPLMELHSDTDATQVDAQYRIEAPARLVMSPPSFRDYLQTSTEVLQPANEILPDNSAERSLWKEEALAGWNEGVAHARTVMDLAFDRLISDYRGILRFKMLADQGLVSVPILARGDLGIQVGDDVLSVDQKVFRITLPASFKNAAAKKAKKKK